MQSNHNVLLTGYRLLEATGTLTSENLGIGDALIPPETSEDPKQKIDSFWFPKKAIKNH